jgi:dTDP-4-amino-4,6-dideoxygalactose transaminase
VEQVEQTVGSDTTAILAVHNVNALCEVSELEQIAQSAGVPLILDSVYALGSRYRGRPTGAFGDAEVFSVHATKLLNGFEGGYITTNDRGLARTLREMRNFGIQQDGSIAMLGLNAKLNELHAAMALTNVGEIEAIVDKNRERLELYRHAFRDIEGVCFAEYGEQCGNCGLVLLEVEKPFPVARKDLIELLRAENALVRAYYDPPLHKTRRRAGEPEIGELPISEDLCERYIQMPAGEFVSEDDILQLSDFFRFLEESAGEMEYALSEKRAHG